MNIRFFSYPYINLNMLIKCSFIPILSPKSNYIPVDIDISPMDNSRTQNNNVSRTYKGHDGFAPNMLENKLRPGKKHFQKNTPEFLQKIIATIDALQSKTPYLFRLDGENDYFDTIEVLNNSGHFFLIKRNLRKEIKEQWLDTERA